MSKSAMKPSSTRKTPRKVRIAGVAPFPAPPASSGPEAGVLPSVQEPPELIDAVKPVVFHLSEDLLAVRAHAAAKEATYSKKESELQGLHENLQNQLQEVERSIIEARGQIALAQAIQTSQVQALREKHGVGQDWVIKGDTFTCV